jgi:hypothetical protein
MRKEWLGGTAAALLAAAPLLAGPEPVTNVRLRHEADRLWVRRMVEHAAERLARPECGRVLSELRDERGQVLQANLDATGLDARSYMLQHIFFYDADERSVCRRSGVVAYTIPGSRVVRVCPRFPSLRGKRLDLTWAVLIHETLHTLGLGENPPSSTEITQVVLRHCR